MKIYVISLLGLYVLMDFTSPRGVAYWSQSYALLVLGMTLALVWTVLVRHRLRLPRETRKVLGTWVGVGSIFLITLEFGALRLYPAYIAGDFLATVGLPVLLILLGLNHPEIFRSRTVLRGLVLCLLLGALVAPVTTDLWGHAVTRGIDGARYDPPHLMLIGLAWAMFLLSRGWRRTWALLLLLVLAGLAALSQERSGVFLWSIAGVTAWIAIPERVKYPSMLWLLILPLALSVVTLSDPRGARPSDLLDFAAVTRFQRLAIQDPSLLGRFSEVRDVLEKMEDANPVRWLVGFGHGATLDPRSPYAIRNLTQSGLIHTIHIGPALLLHRYGLIGVGAYVLFGVFLVRRLLALRRRRDGPGAYRILSVGFLVGAVLAMGEFMVRNVQNDPIVSYLIAAVVLSAIDPARFGGGPTPAGRSFEPSRDYKHLQA